MVERGSAQRRAPSHVYHAPVMGGGSPDRPATPHRAACSNPSGRFETLRRDTAEESWARDEWGKSGWADGGRADGGENRGWDAVCDPDLPPLRTTVHKDTSRTILTRNESPDLPFSLSLNPYRGCEHGCIYCYARPSHSWLGLSPGLDFESQLWWKPQAVALLHEAWRKPTYQPTVIAMGSNTDLYQPIERQHGITRQLLQMFVDCQHPLILITKSALVERDVDLLSRLAENDLVRVAISLTTLDRDLAARLEPRASPPSARLRAIRCLSEAGVPVAVFAAPMIPGLNDSELEAILAAAADHGARFAEWTLVRLPHEVAELFQEWLERYYPLRAAKIWSLLRQSRDGDLSSSRFHERMQGTGPYAQMIQHRFQLALRKLGLRGPPWPSSPTTLFRPPVQAGDQMGFAF